MDGTIGGGPREPIPPSLKKKYIYIYIYTILYLSPLFQKIWATFIAILH